MVSSASVGVEQVLRYEETTAEIIQALKCILRNVRYDTGSSVSFGILSYSGFLHRGKVDCSSDSKSWVNFDPENMFSTFRKCPGKKSVGLR